MRLTKTLILLVAGSCVLPAAADDFGLWPEVSVEKKLGRFAAEASLGARFDDSVSRLTRTDLGFGFSYKPVRNIKLEVGYDFIRDYKAPEAKPHFSKRGELQGYDVRQSFWRPKHRIHFDMASKNSVGRFTLSLRERYQLTRNMGVNVTENRYRGKVVSGDTYSGPTYQADDRTDAYKFKESRTKRKDARTKHYLRSRLSLAYNIRHCPVTPFASFEISNNLSHVFSLDKRRWTLGADWKVARHHTVSLAYVYTNGHDGDDDGNTHAISLGYTFSF